MVNKKAAMEMTMGTVVTIVLMIAILIILLLFINKIRESGTNAIDQIDEAVENQLKTLLSDSENKKVVFHPGREISISKGEQKGFGFLIKNSEMSEGVFTYVVSAAEVNSKCSLTLEEADSLIALRKEGTVLIPSGDILETPIIVKFYISESVPLCLIGYNLDIQKDGRTYLPTISFDLEII